MQRQFQTCSWLFNNFWPRFNLIEDYIFQEGFRLGSSLRDFEKQENGDNKIVEATLNHLHIADIQCWGCEDISEDKIMFLGRVLKGIWEAKLRWQLKHAKKN